MSDIEQRLREAHPNSQQYANGSHVLLEAADEITRLQSEVERLQKQLSESEQNCRDRIKRDRIYCMEHGDDAAKEMALRAKQAEEDAERLRGRCWELEYHADRMLAAIKANDFALDEEAQYKADKLMFDATEDYLIFKEDEAQRLRQQAAESEG